MGKGRYRWWWLVALGLCAQAGCNRGDTDALARIGRKLADRTGGATAGLRDKLQGLKSATGPGDGLQERVNYRLRWEKVLADATIEVAVSGKEIELKGSVKNAEQRTRAVELAESTAGVERVLVSLTVAEAPQPDAPPPLPMQPDMD